MASEWKRTLRILIWWLFPSFIIVTLFQGGRIKNWIHFIHSFINYLLFLMHPQIAETLLCILLWFLEHVAITFFKIKDSHVSLASSVTFQSETFKHDILHIRLITFPFLEHLDIYFESIVTIKFSDKWF